MRKLLWITAGLFVLDLLVILLARPLLILIEGNHEGIGWGVVALRYFAAAIGVGLGIFLVIAWNVIGRIPLDKKNPGA
jgi:hypothetical protein